MELSFLFVFDEKDNNQIKAKTPSLIAWSLNFIQLIF